jgi:hypothetical protein
LLLLPERRMLSKRLRAELSEPLPLYHTVLINHVTFTAHCLLEHLGPLMMHSKTTLDLSSHGDCKSDKNTRSLWQWVCYTCMKRERHSLWLKNDTQFAVNLGPGIRMRYSHAFFKHTHFLSNFFHLRTDARLNCLKNSFKIYIKIDVKTKNVNFNVNFKIVFKTIQLCVSW